MQVTLKTLHFLASYYNMSVFHFRSQNDPNGRDYFLEINPDYGGLTEWDHLNSIDARWIDMSVGLFIDITAVRPNETARAEGKEGALMLKDKHSYVVWLNK